jgi:hypothetical protein
MIGRFVLLPSDLLMRLLYKNRSRILAENASNNYVSGGLLDQISFP